MATSLPETLSRGVVGIVPIRPNRGHAVLGEAKVKGTLAFRPIQEERGVLPNGSVAWVSTFVYNGTPAQLGWPLKIRRSSAQPAPCPRGTFLRYRASGTPW
ncbi:hypothetical protein ACFSC4_08080 [Deinococcus malanensis]|uniref:hypothetical protein n=1 Tax=Deinococcus malanensis TaxID=1706855 RepID=UPI00363178BA